MDKLNIGNLDIDEQDKDIVEFVLENLYDITSKQLQTIVGRKIILTVKKHSNSVSYSETCGEISGFRINIEDGHTSAIVLAFSQGNGTTTLMLDTLVNSKIEVLK